MGVIRECGGRLYMSERSWQAAYEEFFEAFRNYQEAGFPYYNYFSFFLYY